MPAGGCFLVGLRFRVRRRQRRELSPREVSMDETLPPKAAFGARLAACVLVAKDLLHLPVLVRRRADLDERRVDGDNLARRRRVPD